jgi:hypothetical protein
MDSFALDADTAEGLVTGIVDAGDAPPEYRTVALTLHALRAEPDGVEWADEPVAVERIAAAVVVRPRPTRRERRTRRSSSRLARLVAAAGVVGVACVTGAFASAGALPQPAQHAASSVLGTVGISVPSGSETPAEDPPATVEGTTPPGATTPSQPTATAPGVGAAPAVPSNLVSPGNSRNEDPGNSGKNTPPGKANGHDKAPSPNGQYDHSSPHGRGNGHTP